MVDGKLGFIGGAVSNADTDLKTAVLAGGGYVGKGHASKGIMEIVGEAFGGR